MLKAQQETRCPEHGEHIQPWFMHRQVLVCPRVKQNWRRLPRRKRACDAQHMHNIIRLLRLFYGMTVAVEGNPRDTVDASSCAVCMEGEPQWRHYPNAFETNTGN
jgi:hypothetical protein